MRDFGIHSFSKSYEGEFTSIPCRVSTLLKGLFRRRKRNTYEWGSLDVQSL